jgi:hypothetical protein
MANRLPTSPWDEHSERNEVANSVGETDHRAANARFAAGSHGGSKSQARSLYRPVGRPGETAVDLGGTSGAEEQPEDISHRQAQVGLSRQGEIQDSSF